MYFVASFNAIHDRHVDVQNDRRIEILALLFNHFIRFKPVLSNIYLEIFFKQVLNHLEQDKVVIRY